MRGRCERARCPQAGRMCLCECAGTDWGPVLLGFAGAATSLLFMIAVSAAVLFFRARSAQASAT